MTGLIYLLIAIYTKYPSNKKLQTYFKRIGEIKHEVLERNFERTNAKL